VDIIQTTAFLVFTPCNIMSLFRHFDRKPKKRLIILFGVQGQKVIMRNR